MKKPSSSGEWLLYSSFWVALCAGALTLATYRSAGARPDFYYAAFCFFAAYFVYTLDRLLIDYSPEDRLNRPANADWQERRGLFLRLSALAALIVCGVLLFRFDARTIALLLFLGAISFAYVLPVPLLRSRLRDFGALKPFLLAGIWVGGAVWIPLSKTRPEFAPADYFLLADRFVLLLANALMFDVLDRAGDRACGKRTLAVALGRSFVIRATIFLLLLWSLATGLRGVALSSFNVPETVAPYLLLIFLISRYRRERALKRPRPRKLPRALWPLAFDGVLLFPLLLSFW